MKALCNKSPLRSFIAPTPHDSPQNRAAQRICARCPLIRECAEAALTAGNTLKPGFSGPAQGVIQAGVVCRGDLTTAFQLAMIAGVAVPDYQSIERVRRTQAPPECAHCEKPMHRWTRHTEVIPDGWVMHYAGGFCTECRAAYREWRKAHPSESRGLRKMIDRKRHHNFERPAPVVDPGQMELFA